MSTRLVSTRGRWCALALLLAGCGGEDVDADADVEIDSLLVEALVPLHLADARAGATDEPLDSLRAVAYAHVRRATGLDSAAVAARLARLARRPDEASALFSAVQESLGALRP